MKPFFAQGFYYFLSALWPLLHMESFISVTGQKTDLFLVNMVALLTVVIGAYLMMSAFFKRSNTEILFLAVGCALSYASIDIYYTVKRVISPIYLADAALQLALVYWIIASKFKHSRSVSLQPESHISPAHEEDKQTAKTTSTQIDESIQSK